MYDPFLGSGTTLAVAELTERVRYGLELDPKYVDVVVNLWQALSGKKAKPYVAEFCHSLRLPEYETHYGLFPRALRTYGIARTGLPHLESGWGRSMESTFSPGGKPDFA